MTLILITVALIVVLYASLLIVTVNRFRGLNEFIRKTLSRR
jgi:hypothetical protein